MTFLHVVAIIVTGLCVLYSDEQGFEWMVGKKQTLDAAKVELLHIVVSVGLALIILTGGLRAIPALSYYLAQPAFIAKMVFVLALIINGFFIGKLSHMATTRTFASMSSRERIPLFISGGVSVLGWAGALLLGLALVF